MEYTRICPRCKNPVIHKNIISYNKAVKLNKICIKCSRKEVSNRPEEKLKSSKRMKEFTGEKNYFYNKKHSNITKQSISKSVEKYYETHDGPMTGKTIYDSWTEKYGKDVADEKMIEYKQLHSFNSSGEKNGMYGKPSPQGSGNGWSGWYKNIFFRSLLELSFLVNYIERFKMNMTNAECSKYAIKYNDYNGTDRTYFADYIINDKYLVEIKPKKLFNTPLIKSKSDAAKIYCKKNNLIYKLLEPIKIKKDQIQELIDNKTLIFTDITLNKFKNYKKL